MNTFPHPESREMRWKKRLLKGKSAQWQQKGRTNLALKLGERGRASKSIPYQYLITDMDKETMRKGRGRPWEGTWKNEIITMIQGK